MRGIEKSSLIILSMFIISALFPVVSASLLQEDDNFEPTHQGIDFPIGWSDIIIGFGPNSQGFEMIYPAMIGGSDDEMAGNGPFPWVLFFGSDGEAKDGYMELTSEIVKRGYIVLVTQEMQDSNDLSEGIEIAQTALELMTDTNNSHSIILGGFGNVDVNHWALAGHGVGAMTATSLYPYWLASENGNTTHGPSGLFAVGADFSSWNQQFGLFTTTDWQAPAPNTGLFITGTTDEVAPAEDAITRLHKIKDFSWQMMHLLGANHYQFQDTTSIFENDDGDATMSKEAQLDLSSTHIVAYLDAVLRADHSRFRDAFNRPISSSIVSDPDSYAIENLSSADWLKVGAVWSVPNNNESMGPEDTVNLKMDWTLRNGLNYSQLPSEWNVTVVCTIDSAENMTLGQIDSSGLAICLFPMADVQPGQNRLAISVYVEGAPSHRYLNIIRTDSPLVVLTPPAIIDILQRGSTHVDNGLIAYDPDGQSVFLENATLVGQNSQHFHFQIDSDGLGFTVYHSLDEEWTGLNNLRLELRAGGQTIDEAITEITLRVMPVDDPAILIKNIPLQVMDEDSAAIVLNLSEYVFDPEGEEIAGLIKTNTSSELGPVSVIIADGFVTITPLANQNGAVVIHMLVGDGYNTALNLDLPINVLAVDDILVTNNSAWNINATEDEPIVLDLGDFAYDLDGDLLSWSIGGSESSKCNFVIAGNDLMVNVKPDKYGTCNSQYLNVSDGTTTFSATLNVTISPQPDLPTITIVNVNLIDQTAATVQWNLIDLDEEQQADVTFYLENISQNVTSSCNDETKHISKCVTMLVLPQQHDGNITITIRVTDLELNQTVGIEYTLNMNLEPTVEEPENIQSDSISNEMVIIGLAGILLILVIVRYINKNSNSNAQLLRQELPVAEQQIVNENTNSDAENDSESASTGLLARAKKL